MPKSFAEAINAILNRHTEYAPDAYEFMRQALDYTMEQQATDAKTRHLDAKELYFGTCSYALEQYGTLAGEVLSFWGVTSSSDIGNLVYNLIEVGVFGKQEGDSREQFDDLPDMGQLLLTPFMSGCDTMDWNDA